MNDELPELAKEAWPTLVYVQRESASTFSSECPECGTVGHTGSDLPNRFTIFIGARDELTGLQKINGYCRHCGYKAFATPAAFRRPNGEVVVAGGASLHVMTPGDIHKVELWQAEQLAKRAAQLSRFAAARFWETYHAEMLARHRALWLARGLDEALLEFWRVGYTESRQFEHNGSLFRSPALTAPIFDSKQKSSNPLDWVASNIQFRILNPPPGVGKYRQMKDIPAAAWIARPDQDIHGEGRKAGRIVIVEGPIKGMVVYRYVEHGEMQVIGLPGAMSWADIPKRVQDCEEVYIALDPDERGRTASLKLAQAIGKAARVMYLPMKPDDFLLELKKRGENPGAAFARYMKACRRQPVAVN